MTIKRRPLPPFEPSEPFEPERRRRLNPQARQGLSIRRVNLREYGKAPPWSRSRSRSRPRHRRVKLKPLKNLRPNGPSTLKPHRGLSIKRLPQQLPLERSDATLSPCVSTGLYAPLRRRRRSLREYRKAPSPRSSIPTAPKGACPQGANPPVRHFPVPSNFKGEYHGKDLIHQ